MAEMDELIARRERDIPVKRKQAIVIQPTQAAVVGVGWLALLPIHAGFRDMRALDADPHPLTWPRVSQDDFEWTLVHAQDDPGVKISGLHFGHFGGFSEQIDLPGLSHGAGKRPGVRGRKAQAVRQQAQVEQE